ncbi:uncharacterized protein LOC109948137 [Prunus persica]|uniref:uncharacterized protein LOC109948137 n=1 Tax=Prunus persica TaxID=3760 RepID=UPI0009AB5167|nr:uncharacterized protein LOC109948137 [Prunus persica]
MDIKADNEEIAACCSNELELDNHIGPSRSFYWASNNFAGKCLIQSFLILRKADIYYPFTVKGIKIHSTVNLFSAISQVQNLRLSFEIFEILSKRYFEFGGLPPCSFINLKSLQIDTSWSKSYIPGIACLFKSSPVVHTLGIEIKSYCAPDNKWNNNLLDNGHCTKEQFWDAEAQTLSPFLCHLKVVKIRVFQKMGHEGVISIASFLLEHGKNLQEMIIITPKYYKASDVAAWKDKIGIIEGLSRGSTDVKTSYLTADM